jgi:hypothetical protein
MKSLKMQSRRTFGEPQVFSGRTKMVDLDKSALKRNDLRCPGTPVGLNPNAVLKTLCFQLLFSEND